MAQKFVSMDEAAKQLGISKDRLSDLREAGKVRAYRDGTSWKFRADDVEKLLADGVPTLDASGSDVSLGLDADSQDAAPAATSDVELDLGDDEIPASAAASDVSLEDLDEPTVPADGAEDGDVLELSAGNDADEFSDSILLSETELGESTDRPPSTIIGKAEMAADLDLQLAASDSDAAARSDARPALTKPKATSPGGRGDAVLDTEPPSLSDNFGDLDELEIDLEAESSRILSPEDVSKAKRAAKSKAAESKAAKTSDLELAPSDSSSPSASAAGGVLDSSVGMSSGGLSGLSSLELEGGSDDEVLGDGSDITLSSESSGINIISPSDSGLALDEVPLELGSSSPVGSSLDLGADAEVALEPLEEADEAEGGEPFALTPFGEDAAEEEEDSSQIIPLDEVSEDEALLGTSPRPVEALGDDFAAIPAGGMMAVAEPVADTPFPGWIIGLLSICVLTLTMCGMMVFDLLRNMWSWDQVYTLNSTLMDVLAPLLG